MGITLDLGEATEFGLWADHAPAWEAFAAVSGQWRLAAAGLGGAVWLGLDYGAARAGLDLAGIRVDPQTWAELRVIEAGAAAALNRGRED